MGQWSDLPADLLSMIHQDLAVRDKIRFKCVCTHWQSNSPAGLPDLRQSPPPWLLLPCRIGSWDCGVIDPSDKKLYTIKLEEPPLGFDIKAKGLGHGWVVTVQVNGNINAVNPISGSRVPLPTRYHFPDGPTHNNKIAKIAVSCGPDDDSCDFTAVAIYGATSRLAWYKVGDSKWHDLLELDPDRDGNYKDVAFTDGRLYAMNRGGNVMVCDDVVSCPKLRMLVSRPVYVDFSYCNICLITRDEYVRENEGSILLSSSPILGVSMEDFQGSDGNWIFFMSDQLRSACAGQGQMRIVFC